MCDLVGKAEGGKNFAQGEGELCSRGEIPGCPPSVCITACFYMVAFICLFVCLCVCRG